jgi:hypothetical protein
VTLRELHASWIRRAQRIVGIQFDCPHGGRAGDPHPHPRHRICVLFQNPPDGGAPHPDDASCAGNCAGLRWTRAGTTLDDLSLSPSIDATRHDPTCWHGNVEAGRIT